MFRVVPADARTFKHEVTVMTPVDGGHRSETLMVTFNYLSSEEINGFDLRTYEGTTDFLIRAVRHLGDLIDENDRSVPYSDELRDQLIKLGPVRHAISEGFFKALAGVKAGN